MKWQLIHKNEYQEWNKIDSCLLGDPVKPSHFCVLAFEDEKNEMKMITHLPKTRIQKNSKNLSSNFPIAIFSIEELKEKEIWTWIISLLQPYKLELALFWSKHLKGLGIESDVFFEGLQLKDQFQTRSEWEELSQLHPNCLELTFQFDPTLKILRLWNRFSEREKKYWMDLWKDFPFSKNIVHEIIALFYELTSEKRMEAFQMISNYKSKYLQDIWNTSSKKIENKASQNEKQDDKKEILASKIYHRTPREIRDMIFGLRNPHIQLRKRELLKKKKVIENSIFHLAEVQIPDDMEYDSINLTLDIKNKDDALTLSKQLGSESFLKAIETFFT